MKTDKEIRSYVSSSVANGIVGIMAVYPSIMILVVLSMGNVFALWLPTLIFLALILLWVALRKGTYIAIDLEEDTLDGSAVFFPPRKIPVSSIVDVGVGSMFLSWTVMKITFQPPHGEKRTVGVGVKQTLDKVQFRGVLDALVRINPKLKIPTELRNP